MVVERGETDRKTRKQMTERNRKAKGRVREEEVTTGGRMEEIRLGELSEGDLGSREYEEDMIA